MSRIKKPTPKKTPVNKNVRATKTPKSHSVASTLHNELGKTAHQLEQHWVKSLAALKKQQTLMTEKMKKLKSAPIKKNTKENLSALKISLQHLKFEMTQAKDAVAMYSLLSKAIASIEIEEALSAVAATKPTAARTPAKAKPKAAKASTPKKRGRKPKQAANLPLEDEQEEEDGLFFESNDEETEFSYESPFSEVEQEEEAFEDILP